MNGGITELTIRTGSPYPVWVGEGLLRDCGELLARRTVPCTVFLVSDDVVAPLYMERTAQAFAAAGFTVVRHMFPHGEAHKTPETLMQLVEHMAQVGLTRADIAAALGGGVTGDLTGFAASVYQRGIRCVQLPTTVLAAVDSSVGGKTAVDLPAGKNLMGSFWQPFAVICDCETFATLPPAVYADGLAEAVKYGVLCDPALFARFEGFSRGDATADLIARCISIKEQYVAGDETDHGKRQFLNLGHTPAHAIEKCSGYAVSHGSAVAAGMVLMARASERLGYAAEAFSDRLAALLARFGLPTHTDFTARQLSDAAVSDKKRRGDTLTLVMPRAIGDCVLVPVKMEELERIFEAGIDG